MANMFGIPVRRHWFHFAFLWLLGAAIVAACGGNDQPAKPQLGSEIILSGNAVLTCSQECRDRGQCGILSNTSTPVILVGSPERPTTSPRRFAMQEGAAVTITGAPQLTTLILATDINAQETVNFYPVSVVDRAGEPGWVAGWCLAAAAQ